jgi:hypothetical protein
VLKVILYKIYIFNKKWNNKYIIIRKKVSLKNNMYKNIYLYNNIIKLDAPTPWGLFFQDSATPQMEGIEELHNNIMFYLAIILFTVTWMMITIIRSFVISKSWISHKNMNHGK